MAQITINDKLAVNGKMTFNRTLIADEEGNNSFLITGVLSTHLYFEEITKIETSRYILNGVEVYQESYGSDDYDIVYSFRSKDLIIKGEEYEGVKFILYPEEMEEIENKMYKNDHPILGDIGEEYRDIIKKEKEGE